MLNDGNDNDDELITLLKTEVIPTLKEMKRLLESLESQHERCELNCSMEDYIREKIDDYQIRIDESESITEQNVFRIIIEVYRDLLGGENRKQYYYGDDKN